MKKKLSLLGAVMLLMCLIVIPVSASAISPTAYVGSKYSHSFDGTTLTVQVFAGDVNNQPAASGPTLVQITYGFSTSPTNWVTHTIPMSLVSSSPSTGWYTYTVNPPTGSTVGVIEVKFPNHVIGGNVWYPVP